MLLKTGSILIYIPKTFYGIRYLRINSEIIGEYTICIIGNSFKEITGTLNLIIQIFKWHAIKTALHKRCDRLH